MFDVIVAEEIMRRDLITVQPESPVMSSISKMLKANISGAPVIDKDGGYVGVFSEKCSLNALSDSIQQAKEQGIRSPQAKEFMTRKLITLTEDWDVFQAIDHLLANRISGAPVVDNHRNFLGVFSEKTAMQVLIAAIYDSVPGSSIGAFLNVDRNRIMDGKSSLQTVAEKFKQTPYRRLPILNGSTLEGQVSRRDVIKAELDVSTLVTERVSFLEGSSQSGSQPEVGDFVDRNALTINPQTDLLTIAQMFLNSTHRRLPVLDTSQRLVGQISRRDLLNAALQQFKPPKEHASAQTLYLSQVSDGLPSSLR